jgi:hypothetical protein
VIDDVLSDAVGEIDRYLRWEIGPYTEGELRSRIVAVRDQMDALRSELDTPTELEPAGVIDEEHERHCVLAGCAHPAVYEFPDGAIQGWCSRCRAVAFGGVFDGVEFRHGRIVDAETGEELPGTGPSYGS